MKTLIVYDSAFGNTKQLAEAMGKAVSVSEANISHLKNSDLVIFGTPTQGGRPTAAIQQFIESLPEKTFIGLKIAVFDTRLKESEQNFALRLLMKTIGYAAPKMAESLKSKGGKLTAEPEGFFVTGKKGPLKNGELERAAKWAKTFYELNKGRI